MSERLAKMAARYGMSESSLREIEKITAKALSAAKALPTPQAQRAARERARRWARMAKAGAWEVAPGTAASFAPAAPVAREAVESRADRRERMAARYGLTVEALREIERETARRLRAAKALPGKERARAREKALAWSRAAKRKGIDAGRTGA